jgi:hypothetical protein
MGVVEIQHLPVEVELRDFNPVRARCLNCCRRPVTAIFCGA